MNKQSLVLGALVLGTLTGCAGSSGGSIGAGSESNGKSDAAGYYSNSGGSAGPSMGVYGSGGTLGSGGTTTLPPEQKQNLDFLAPRAGAKFVYVANPTRNTVTAIDSTTLEIDELAPGDSPTYLATVPGQDIALVVNVGSHTLRILNGKVMNAGPIPIIAKANAIAISPDGKHAVIWFDASQVAAGTTQTTTTGSTQEVSVVDLSTTNGSVISMTVGYNPSAVVFSSDNAAAFVVTDDGISELRFANITAPGLAPLTRIDTGTISLTRADAGADTTPAPPDTAPTTSGPSGTGGTPGLDGGLARIDGGNSLDGGSAGLDGQVIPADTAPDLGPPDTYVPPPSDTAPVMASGKPTEVSVTADGSYAVARRDGSYQLLLVNLKTQTVTALDLSSTVTDLVLLPSGNTAFAVLREESKLVSIDVPSGFTDSAHRTTWPFDGETIGSVTMSAKGRYALLYTTAIAINRLVIVDLTNESAQTVDVHEAIRAVAIAPDEKTALVLHSPPTTSGTGGTSGKGGSSGTVDNFHGYTMVELAGGREVQHETAVEPNPFAITPNSTYAFVLLRDDTAGVRIAQRISLTSFVADDFLLGSPPSSIAALSVTSQKVFVGQVYSEGRISFIDWVTGEVQTVTGFALNGRIQQ